MFLKNNPGRSSSGFIARGGEASSCVCWLVVFRRGQITVGCRMEVVRPPKRKRSASSRGRLRARSSSSRSRSRSAASSRYSGHYSRSPSPSSCRWVDCVHDVHNNRELPKWRELPLSELEAFLVPAELKKSQTQSSPLLEKHVCGRDEMFLSC